MPLYAQQPSGRRRPLRKRRPVGLTPFRGVPKLRAIVEAAMRKAVERMHRQVADVAQEPLLSAMQRSERLNDLLDKWGGQFDKLAKELAWRMVHDTSEAGRQHWMEQATKAMGVPAAAIFDSPEMQTTLENAAVAAATYIKSIPQEHIGKVAAALVTSLRQEQLPEGRTLAEHIEHIGGVTKRRAQFIARDQLHKVRSDIDEAQQRDIGIDEFIWRTSQDERVVGNPGGKYPKGTRMHGDHYHRNGKKYRWDKPPGGELPGKPIGCRCYAQPMLDVNKILGL